MPEPTDSPETRSTPTGAPIPDGSATPEGARPPAADPTPAGASPAEEVPADLVPRGLIGGILMGLANLVPGISGGTMLLAVGIYPRFIGAIARATTLRLDRATVLTLGSVGVAAGAAIVLLAGPVKELVVSWRWGMYSLFIGLTLGGVPIVWALIREAVGRMPGGAEGAPRIGPRVAGGAIAGFVGMAALAWVQMQGAAGGGEAGWLVLLLGGVSGAAAMILPGVSGGYLLLVLGAYVPILSGIDTFRAALSAGDLAALGEVVTAVILPVGLGVVVGVVGVAHLLRWLLDRFELATLGVLLGLLVGAVVGLWPFQQSRLPVEGELIKGQAVEVVVAPGTESALEIPGEPEGTVVRFAATGEAVELEDLPVAFFSPTGAQAAGALGLVLAGLAITTVVGRIGGRE